MATVIVSPADVVNLALAGIGRRDRIGSIYEGSAGAKAALDLYSQTRDEMLRSVDYGFAERNVNMELLKSANAGGYFPPNQWNGTVNPPPGYLFSYAYPDDCLKVRAIKSQPLFTLDYDPQPVVFKIENDNYFTPSRKVILCNIESAQMVYTAQITDPTRWEADFVAAFAAELGRRLAPTLANMDAAKFAAAVAGQATAVAERTEG